jgi:hypothetical protein
VNQCSLVVVYWCFKISYWPYHRRYFQQMTATFILTDIRTSRRTPLGHFFYRKFWHYVFQSQQHPHGQNIYSVIHTFHIMWLSGPISSYTCWLISHSGLGSSLSVNPNIRRFHHISKIKLLLLFASYESFQALMLILRSIFSSYYIYFNTNNQKCVLKLEEHMQSKTNTVYNYCGCIVYYWIHLTIMEDKIWTYW